MALIYHIAIASDWEARGDRYAPAGWRDEGFIHCCTSDQLVSTANRHFPNRSDLVLLSIDTAQVTPLVVWEDTSGRGEDFPHIYGEIDIAAVVAAEPFPCGTDGRFDSWSDAT